MTTPFAAAAFAERYGAHAPEHAAWNPVIASMLSHRSVRAYSEQPLADDVVPALIAAAQSAASSSNLQAWSVVAVTDPARKAQFAALAGEQAHIRECPVFLVWLADLARLAAVAQARELPHTALDYTEMLLLGVIDAALAAQNATVAAESLGLGTVYIGALRNKPLEVAELLKLPPRVVAVFGLCVGYPDPERPAAIKPRLPQAAVLHHETYNPDQAVAIEQYDATMNAFYAAQQMNVKGGWTVHSAKRVAGPQSLSGRDVLRSMLERLGFAQR